jgi:low temperature requirement protein LtrA
MTYSFYEDPAHNTYTALVGFYLGARFKVIARYSMNALLLPMVNGMMVSQAVMAIIPAALWIASIHVAMPNRLGLIWTALILDLYGHNIFITLLRFSRKQSQSSFLGKIQARFFDFYPAMNIEHRVERTNAFVSLILGYAVISVMFQSYGGHTFNAFLGKAVLGLVQAFIFNWIYFDIDGSNLHLHAIRRSVWAGTFMCAVLVLCRIAR